MELGGFSLIVGDSGLSQTVAQVCDKCQICDSGGGCWDYKGDGDDQDNH